MQRIIDFIKSTRIHRMMILMGLDVLSILISYFAALLLRFDFRYSRIFFASPPVMPL